MPNPAPVEGRCNARRRDGSYCANKPHNPGKNKRCKHHGGMSTGPKTPEGKAQAQQNAIKHGLYARVLRSSFPTAKLRNVFDQVSRGTDMADEIALMRAKVAQFATWKAEGIDTIETGEMQDGSKRFVEVDTLLQRAIQTLNQLTRSQHEMHPEAGAAGKLQINITVSGEAKRAAEADLGDLEAGGGVVEEEAGVSVEDPAPLPDEDPLAGLGDDP